jgi:diaminopimelate decarboxylase
MADRHDILADVARQFGTPYFIYFLDDVQARLDALRQAFGGRFEVSYAVKSNPNPALLAWMKDHVAGPRHLLRRRAAPRPRGRVEQRPH